MSREQLALNINYSKNTIYNIEKNKNLSSIELLNTLSTYFNLDLSLYLTNSYSFSSIYSNTLFVEFRDCIIHHNFDKLNFLIEKCENDTLFGVGEGLKLIYYSKALIKVSLGDYNNALKYSLLVLALDNIDLENTNIESAFFTPTTYSTLGLLTGIYEKLNNYTLFNKLATELYFNLDKTFSNDNKYMPYHFTHNIRMYIIATNNYSTLLISKKDYNIALKHIRKAISFSYMHYNCLLLYSLYFTEFECLYKLKDYTNAVTSLECVLLFCSNLKKDYVNIYIKKINSNFSNILNYTNLDRLVDKYSYGL